MRNTTIRRGCSTPRLGVLLLPTIITLLLGVAFVPTRAYGAAESDALDAAYKRFNEGKYDDAVVSALGGIKSSDPSVASEAQRMIGISHSRTGDYAKAIQSFTELMKSYPDMEAASQGYFWLGFCYEKQYDSAQAAANYEKQIAQFPKHARTWETRLRLGDMYRAMKRYDDALAQLNIVLAENPERAMRAHYLIAESYIDQGKYADAIPALKKGIDAAPKPLPSDDHWYLKESRFNLAGCYLQIKDFDSAISVYSSMAPDYVDKAVEIKLDIANAMLFGLRNPDGARMLLQETITQYANDENIIAVRAGLAACSYVELKFSEAAKLYEEAFEAPEKGTWRPFLLYMAGDCYQQAGDKENAKIIWEKLMKLYPNDPWSKIANRYYDTLAGK